MKRLAVLIGPVLVTVLTLLLCASPPAWAGTDRPAGFSTDARVALNTYASLVEQHLSSTMTGLAAVAATEEAASGDWERIRGPLSEVSRRVPTSAAVWFVRPDGSYYTVERGPAGESLADRAYFPGLMAGNEVYGDLVISKSTGKRSAIVAVPIRTEAGVIGAVGASIDLEKLAAEVGESMTLPPDVLFYALDADGQATLHQDSERIFEFPSDLGSESLSKAVARMLRDPTGSVTYKFRGEKKLVLFERSEGTGWIFVLGKVDGRV